MSGKWQEKDILITVKTYPEYSDKYAETVCTCGILADTRKMIRIYPIRFRYLDGESKFIKYQWIKAEIKKAERDPRPESYNINNESIRLGTVIEADKKGWAEREKWLINDKNVFDSIEILQEHREKHNTSLGIIKPKTINDFRIEKKNSKEMHEAQLKKQSIMAQDDIFIEIKDLEILPCKFFLNFNCNTESCKGHDYSILDWEIAELYRKTRNRVGWERKLKEKVMEMIFGPKRETYLLVGNMLRHQKTFCTLGFFWPPKQRQLLLDFD